MAPGRKAALLAAFLVSVSATSCAPHAVAGFEWKDASGARMAFGQSAPWDEGLEGRFGPGRLSNRYTLAKPYEPPSGHGLELSVAGTGQVGAAPGGGAPSFSIVVGSGRGGEALAKASFPLRAGLNRLVVPLPDGAKVAYLEAALEPEAATAQILAIGDSVAYRGYREDDGAVRVSAGFSYLVRGGESVLAIGSPFPPAREGGATEGGLLPALVLEYRDAPEGGRLSIIASGGAKGSGGEELRLRTRRSGSRLVLSRSAFPGDLSSIGMRAPAGTAIKAFCVDLVGREELELADLGRVLLSAPEREGADYDLYRWDLLPRVLVLDFMDYATQDRYLKRLAFFVEKAGFRGTLQRDEVIGPLHGWNAHDYRPEDLAAFFEKARKQGFPLGREEKALERLLVERGVVVERGGRLEAGAGALISISRESSAYLRRTFIVHESTHALFFADAEYRAFVTSVWKAMDSEEKWFWKRYFQWMVYDTSSEYLMANEYQAYLLQQPLARAKDYFTKTLPANLLVPDVLARDPGLDAKVAEYMASFGESFEPRAAELEAWLARKYGIAAGRTYFLE